MGRRAELRELSDAEVRAWMAPRRAGWQIAIENSGIDGSVGAIVRAHNAFAGGGIQLIGRAKYNKRAAVGTNQHEPIRVLTEPEGSPLVSVEADTALPPLPDALWPAATYVLGHDAVGLSPMLAACCDARFGPPPGWNAATSPSMLAHLLMARLRGGGVRSDPPTTWISPHADRAPAWIDGWEALPRPEQRARLGFGWWVERFAWETRRDWWLCLPDAQTPLNAVAAARNALAAGAAGLVTTADPGPERAPLGERWRVEPFAATLARARTEGRPLLALEQHGSALDETALPPRAMVVAGHEVDGLGARHLRACDAVITLPQWGSVNSLNVASAVGLVLDAAPEAGRRIPEAGTGSI